MVSGQPSWVSVWITQPTYGRRVLEREFYRARISIAFVIHSVDLIQSLDLLRSGESRPGGRSYRVRWAEDSYRARYSLA